MSPNCHPFTRNRALNIFLLNLAGFSCAPDIILGNDDCAKNIAHWTELHQLHHVARLHSWAFIQAQHFCSQKSQHKFGSVQLGSNDCIWRRKKHILLHWAVVHQLPVMPGYPCFHPNTTVCSQAQLLHISSWEAMTALKIKHVALGTDCTTLYVVLYCKNTQQGTVLSYC